MVGRSALRGSDKRSNIDSMAGRLPCSRSRMAEEADSISGGARLRGSARHIDANSIAGRSCMAEELGPERGPELGSRIQSDMDSGVARGAPRRGVGGHIKADLLESTDDSDSGWPATDPGAGLRKDASLSLDRQRDRYLIIFQNNVALLRRGSYEC